MEHKHLFFLTLLSIIVLRYSELVAIHGKLDPLVHVDLTPEKRVKVTFTYGDLVEVNLRFARRPNLINVRLIKFKDYRLSVAIYIYILIGQFIRLIYSKRGKGEGRGQVF